MIDRATQNEIIRATQALWDEKCAAGELAAYMLRKERGHGLADWVEDETVGMLEDLYRDRAAFQREGPNNDDRRLRSMGDIWIESGGIFNPVNIKTGVKKPGRSTGQPNLVSLAKLTNAILKRWIDSYYLLLIRFVTTDPVTTDPPTANTTLVDLLLIMKDYVSFHSGPGQLMLRAGKFDDPPPPIYDVMDPATALAHLLHVREEGNRKLAEKRDADLSILRTEMQDFDPLVSIEQEELLLDPAR